jgi:hypothetical protein
MEVPMTVNAPMKVVIFSGSAGVQATRNASLAHHLLQNSVVVEKA